MTEQELKKYFEDSKALAEKDSEKNKEFLETMEKQLDEMSKAAVVTKPPGAEKLDPKGGFFNFADYASAVFKDEVFRGQSAKQDKRLMAWQEKTAGEGMEEGTDSEGGYGLNAHLKLDHMLETPKVLMTTEVTL